MKYWVYMNGEIPGSYEPIELAAMPGFKETAMVCPAEGGAEERNWQRAGQFPDILETLRQAQSKPPLNPMPQPAPADFAGDPGRPRTPNDVLSDASSQIFRHVSNLMKELENRREERALTQALQRQLIELKNELMAVRERNQYLQDRAALIPGFEDREAKLQRSVTDGRTKMQEAEANINELRRTIETLNGELDKARRGEASLSEDLKRQSAVNEELSQDLAQKEFTLAKAFGIIRRLETELGEILPSQTSGISRSVPDYPQESKSLLPTEEPATQDDKLDSALNAVLEAAAETPQPAQQTPQAAPSTASEHPRLADAAPSASGLEPGTASEHPRLADAAPSASGPAPGDATASFEIGPEPGAAELGMDAPPPPEGDLSDEVTPVPAPWKQKLRGFFSKLLGR